MEHNNNEYDINPPEDNLPNVFASKHAQVSSSFLPAVLQRLGLTPEQATRELAVDDLLAMLKSEHWEQRVAALHTLGKLETAVPPELLISVFDDPDATVRAAAIRVMANAGKRAPLHRLITATHDPDWHVRETAILVLVQQQRIPPEVLTTALHDTDTSVREAAMTAPQFHALDEKTTISYRPWEHKTMQNQYDTQQENYQNGYRPTENAPYNADTRTTEYQHRAEPFQVVREQTQAYAPQPYPTEEPMHEIYGHGEKIHPRPRSSHKGLWSAIVITALIFFLLGAGVAVVLPAMKPPLQSPFPMGKSGMVDAKPRPELFTPLEKLLSKPEYSTLVQTDISTLLHLSSQDIITQLKQGQSLSDIAKNQNVSLEQLQAQEATSLQNVINKAISDNNIDRDSGQTLLTQVQNFSQKDPTQLTTETTFAFLHDAPASNP